MPVELTYTIEGAKELHIGLGKLGDKIKDPKEPLNDAADGLLKLFTTNFTSEGALFGGWAPLKESTIKEKIRLGFPLRILERTGLLRSSFKKEVTSSQATLYNPIEYFQQYCRRRKQFLMLL